MLIRLDEMIAQFGLKIHGILHLGAHTCEELNDYLKYIDKQQILWIEGNAQLVTAIRQQDASIRIVEAVVSDRDDQPVTLNITNNGQSSSILALGTHTKYYPHIKYIDQCQTKTKTVATIYKELYLSDDFANFVNIDLQGAELLALRGMGNLLDHVDYIYTEVNREQLYENCPLVNEIDTYLDTFGFTRVMTRMTGQNWGDALYIKNK